MAYTGPKKIVVVGGGIAGLAAADAISAALEPLARAGTLPAGIELLLVESEAQVGGRAMTWNVVDIDAAEHPHRHHRGFTPHGIHFLWHSYAHFLEWTRDAAHVFSPERPISTYCAWLTPPDLAGDFHGPGKVVALHVCDPQAPATAWDPRARAILEAFRRGDRWISLLEDFVRNYLVRDVEVDDWLAFLDILFDETNLSPQLRWGCLFLPAFVAQLGRVEKSPELHAALGGRFPQDVEVSELVAPFYEGILVKRLRDASAALAPYLAGEPGPTSVAPLDSALAAARGGALSITERLVFGAQSVLDGVGLLPETARAGMELLRLLLRDARVILDGAARFDPRQSGYLKNLYKAAFSSPYEFDLATALRDVQMGFRNFQTAKLQVFDGDDAQALWDHVRARIEARRAAGVDVTVRTSTWAKHIEVVGGRVARIDLATATAAPRAKRPIATVEPVEKGATSETRDVDVVVSTLLPACLKPLLSPGQPSTDELRRRLGGLSRYVNETINLQLLLERRIELPFVDPPNLALESKPFSISNLEGIFTILVDLSRAWRPATFRALRFDSTSSGDFAGSAWELVGSWADAFTHDSHAAPARYQWPLGAQHVLARLAHDIDDYEYWSVDDRRWALETGLPQPVFGEIKRDAATRDAYFTRWVDEVGPIVVEQTLRQIAALPGLAAGDKQFLKDLGADVARGRPVPLRWIFSTSRQAETKFFSAEPFTYELRPHSRFETPVAGLWCAGDWTRSGLNVQAMEGALLSGLHSAAGVIEAMRAGGLSINGPHIMPDMVPNGAWDAGP